MSKMLLCNARYLVSRPGPAGGIFEDGAVYIDGPLVGDVGRSADLEARYLHLPGLDVIDMKDKIILPGLVDAHNHVGEAHTLLVEGWLDTPIRGIVDATDRIYWPAYGWLTEESAYDLTLFGLLNVLKHGATTHADAMIFPEAMAHASIHARARTILHPQMISSVALPDAGSDQEYLAQTEAVICNYHNQLDGLIRVGVHANAVFNCSPELLLKGMELAWQYGVQFAVHIAESDDEKARADLAWGAQGGLVGHMQELGLVGRQTLLFHGSLLNEAEIDYLAGADAALIHCPATNAWFGQCAYLPYMVQTGMRLGLGTDCVTHDLFSVMLSVLQHHNIMPRPLRGLPTWKIFELATLGGARALGMEDQIGSLEPGKRADLITLDLRRNTSLFPLSVESLYDRLALTAAGSEACDVIIDGIFIRRQGAFTSLDEEAIIARAAEWCRKFSRDYASAHIAGQPFVRRIQPEFQ
jgi:cytosine/adenosine deaminase-related metal-dependent hydrolase